ncbi:MAG: PDZ domain-containing protein [Bacteroidales bacterium]|nr:PDZ domain-containing protein [Bacteroidales bacterium]
MKIILSIIILISLSKISSSQELKRRAYLGVYGTEITDSVANIYNINSGINIDSLTNISLTKKHKLVPADILLSINGNDVKTLQDLKHQVSLSSEGDKVNFKIIRKGKIKEITGIYPVFPFEESETHEIIYDKFEFDGGYIRVIIDKPKGQDKLPAILFIQGYTCSSIDNVGDKHPYIQLVKGLCEKGYVVMRIEKPGIGDCNNITKCNDIDFKTENEAFLKGLQKLKSYDFVDTSKVFIWGHSLGGITAPIIANQEKVKGIIVYGTTLKPWREYLVEMFRVQNPLFGIDYVENENNMLDYYKLIHSLFIDKNKPSIIEKDSTLSTILKELMLYNGDERIWGRNYKAFVQIDDYNLTECWSKTDANVLVFWADADIEAFSRYDHETIVDVVNHYHPGKGKFIHLKNTTHAFAKVKSMQHGIENRSWKYLTENFNEEIIFKTDEWIKEFIK